MIVVGEDPGGAGVAAILRLGAADFAVIAEPDEVVLAVEHALSQDRQSRRRQIEAAAAAAVRNAEQHMESVFTEAPIGMSLASLTGTLIRVNPKLCEISGRTEGELVGSNFQTLVHPEDALIDQEQIVELLAGKRSSYQVRKRYFQRSGATLWIDQSVSLARAEDGSPLYFIAQFVDITAQREAEVALQSANTRMRAIFDHAPVWLALRGLDGRYLNANNELAQVYRTTDEKLIGAYPADFAVTPRTAKIVEDDRVVSETKRPVSHEVSIEHPTRGRRDYHVVRSPVLDGQGELEAVGSFAMDITDRKEADATRDRALEQFAEAQEIANVGSWVWNAATDQSRMVEADEAHLRPGPGRSAPERRGVLRPDRARGPRYRHPRLPAGRGRRPDVRDRVPHQRGRRRAPDRPRAWSHRPRHPGVFVGTVQDVTELRAIERDAQAARERFRVAFENAPVGMTISTADGQVLQVNALDVRHHRLHPQRAAHHEPGHDHSPRGARGAHPAALPAGWRRDRQLHPRRSAAARKR